MYGEKRSANNSKATFTTTLTTRGWLSDGCNYPLTANGGVGKDVFTLQRNRGTVDLNGDDGMSWGFNL